jgi:3-methyladenine DNA glycosylase Tag
MRRFDEIMGVAVERKGSDAAVLAGIDLPKSADELAAIPDHRWLAQMARGILQAGISWTVVDKKWPGIEEAFHGFDVGRVSMMSDDWFDQLIKDTRIIRSPPKVRAIQHNAAFIREVSAAHGSFGRRIGDWPEDDFMGLLDWLQKNGSRLGGGTGSYMLRFMGKDAFILSRDVVARLVAEGVVDKAPTSKKAKLAVQEAFNTWKMQSGRSFNEISRTLAQSIDA